MANKTLVTFKGKCVSANKTMQGASIQLANDITNTDKGPAAREVVVINVKDATQANAFTVGNSYTVTVTD